MFWSQPRTGLTGLNHTALDRTPPPPHPGSLVQVQLHVGADAAAACEHVPHGERARQVGFAVVCDVDRHGQVQVLLLDAAVVDALAAVPQAIGLMVERRLGRRGRLEVERRLIVRARRTEGLRAGQFSCQGRGGEKGGAIWDGGGGGRSRHNVVVGMDGREAGRDGEVRLLLLRLRLFFLTAIILEGEEDVHENMVLRSRQRRSKCTMSSRGLIIAQKGDRKVGGGSIDLCRQDRIQDTDQRNDFRLDVQFGAEGKVVINYISAHWCETTSVAAFMNPFRKCRFGIYSSQT